MNSTESNENVMTETTNIAASNVNVGAKLNSEEKRTFDNNSQSSTTIGANTLGSHVVVSESIEKCEGDVENTDNTEKELINTLHDPSNSKEFSEFENTAPSSHAHVQETSASEKSKSKQNSSQKSKHCSPRKHRAKHCKKRKWKPYMKLTWSERRKLEERDTRRASRIREEMSSCGLTLAPYNTTQFIMEDHNFQEPNYDQKIEPMVSYIDPAYLNSPDDEQVFLEKEFEETYDSLHDDYINGMSKYDLVCELMRLEDDVEQLEKTLNEARRERMNRSEDTVEADLEKINVFQEEIEKMTQENDALNGANYQLYEQVQRMS